MSIPDFGAMYRDMAKGLPEPSPLPQVRRHADG